VDEIGKVVDGGARWSYFGHNKEIIKIRSRQHEQPSQCDGPAWLMSERGIVNSWFPFIDGVSLPTTSR
jgi:hypothetical protein